MSTATYLMCRPQTLQGAIVPLSWDQAHQAKSFGIFTEQGEDITIEPHSTTKVQAFLHSWVKISGMVCVDQDGQEIMKVEFVENATQPLF